mgnify:CR=1 FL=1
MRKLSWISLKRIRMISSGINLNYLKVIKLFYEVPPYRVALFVNPFFTKSDIIRNFDDDRIIK